MGSLLAAALVLERGQSSSAVPADHPTLIRIYGCKLDANVDA